MNDGAVGVVFLIFLLMLFVVIFPICMLVTINTKVGNLASKMEILEKLLAKLNLIPTTKPVETPTQTQTVVNQQVEPVQKTAPAPKAVESKIIEPTVAIQTSNQKPTPTPATPSVSAPVATEKVQTPTPPQPQNIVPPTPSEFEIKTHKALKKIYNWLIVGEEFRPANIALEYAVVTVWLIRFAIIILLFGISFFVKYSHENGLLPPELRLIIALIVGISLIVTGSMMIHKKYHIIALSLMGIGTGTLYFIGFAGVALYHILPPLLGFGLLILVTVSSTILAIKHNALSLGLISITGGYLTPFLVSTGQKNLIGLFSYIILLGIGALIVGRYKNWKIFNIVSFVFNYGIFFLVVCEVYDSKTDFVIMLSFMTASFLLFSAMSIIYNLKFNEKITMIELIMLILNFLIYLGMSLIFVNNFFGKLDNAIYITVGLTLFYIIQFYSFLKFKKKDINLYLAIGTFSMISLTLSFPILFSNEILVLFWSIQAVAVLYLASKINSRFLAALAMLLYVITGINAVYNTSFYVGNSYWSDFLQRFMNIGCYSLSLIGGFFVQKYNKSDLNNAQATYFKSTTMSLFRYSALVFVGAYLFRESSLLPFSYAFKVATSYGLNSLIICGILLFLAWRCNENSKDKFLITIFNVFASIGCIIIVITTINYLVNLGTYHVGAQSISFAALLSILVAIQLFTKSFIPRIRFNMLTIGAIIWFTYSSFEVYFFSYKVLESRFAVMSISVLWSFYALLMIFLGLKFALKNLRICGFILFLISGLKLILLDMSQLHSLYRVGGFIAIGILMIAGAFFYIKADKIFKTNEVKK